MNMNVIIIIISSEYKYINIIDEVDNSINEYVDSNDLLR